MRTGGTDLMRHALSSRGGKPYLLVLVGLLVLRCNSVAAEPATEAIGDYAGLACPKGDLTCVPTKSADRLRIFRAPDGKVRIDLHIAFDRGQRCQLQTDLTIADGVLRARAEGLQADAMCELILRPRDGVITIEDSDQRCREVYCGVRGTFSGTRFKRR
jgi:hypothetical protein